MNNIYREQLMEHYKNPRNFGTINSPTVKETKNNPFCGDVIEMQLKIEDGIIKEAAFSGSACAVSIASASMLTEEITGKTVDEANKVTKEELLEMVGVELTTSRVKCAVLALEALNLALKKYEQNAE